MPAKFFRAAPYADDAMNLPVRDVEEAVPFYESKMGFQVVSRSDDGCRRVVLERDTIQIELAQNGGDIETRYFRKKLELARIDLRAAQIAKHRNPNYVVGPMRVVPRRN